MRARIDACPGKELPLAFVGDDPPPIAQLHARAVKQVAVIGFNATGDAYVVKDGPGEYVIIAFAVEDVREDPSVAKAANLPPG